jgi:hypothetical protein
MNGMSPGPQGPSRPEAAHNQSLSGDGLRLRLRQRGPAARVRALGGCP